MFIPFHIVYKHMFLSFISPHRILIGITRLQALAKRIAGARKQDALALLQSLEGAQAATMHLSGSERATLPADPSRIIITVGGG
jgi:hypothetical protein